MSRLPIKIPDPSGNMATNGKVTFTFPRGAAYRDYTMHFQDGGVDMTVAQMKARTDSIVVRVGGKAVREWTATTLDLTNSTNGAQYSAVNGYLTDWFDEPWRRTMEGEERNAWGTQGVGDITVEIKFNGAAVAPTVEIYAFQAEADRPLRAYPIRHVRNHNVAIINGTTQWPGNGLLREVGLWYDRIHFLSANVTSINIEADKYPKWDRVARGFIATWYPQRGLSLQASTYSVIFSGRSLQLTDLLSSFKPGSNPVDPLDGATLISDLRIEITANAAGSSDVVTEQYQVFK